MMGQVRLENKTNRRVLDGELVRLFSKAPAAFIVANLNEFGIIGTVSGTIEKGQIGNINLINTVDYTKLINTPTSFPIGSHEHEYSDIGNYPSRVVTDDTTELTTDYTIICNKATSMTVQWDTLIIKDYLTGLWKII